VDVIAAAITRGGPADSIFPSHCRICAILLKRERERERERKTSWKWGMIGLGKGQPRGHLTRLKLTTIVTIKERSPRIRLTPLSDRLESCRKQQRCGGA